MIGWECPRCSRCYSPFVPACFHCGPGITTAGGANAIPCPGCGKDPCDHSSTGCPPINRTAAISGGR